MKRVEYFQGTPILDDDTPVDFLFQTAFGRGLVERDFNLDPPEMFDAPSQIVLIPESEYSARIKEQEASASSLWHLWTSSGAEHLSQGNVGYCWAHSTAHAMMLAEARDTGSVTPLSAFAVAATIKKGADQGGWCGQSAKFIKDRGIPSQAFWPQGSRDYRKYDTPEVWADAAKRKIDEDWYDLTKPIHGQIMTEQMVNTCLLLNQPVAHDNYAWSHSTCAVQLVEVERGSFARKHLNSWPNWGDKGFALVRGKYAVTHGAISIRTRTLIV